MTGVLPSQWPIKGDEKELLDELVEAFPGFIYDCSHSHFTLLDKKDDKFLGVNTPAQNNF